MSLRAILCASKMAVSAAMLVLACALDAGAQNPGAAPAWNDNSLIVIQKRGGDPARAGDVRIEFYGHDAFKITSPEGVTVLTDPWRNDSSGQYPKWFLNEFPALRVDIVLSTHAHFDHDAVELPNALMVLNRLVGRFKLGDVEIEGLADKHQCESPPDPALSEKSANCPPEDSIGLDNTIQVIATGGLRIAVWGDNRATLDSMLDRYLKNVDVLILPVDTVLSRVEADAVIRRYDPKAIIPAHYLVERLTAKESGLDSADGWVSAEEKNHVDVRRLDRPDLILNTAALKGCHHRIYYFGNHFEKQ